MLKKKEASNKHEQQRFCQLCGPSRHVRPEWQILSELLHMGTATQFSNSSVQPDFPTMTLSNTSCRGNLALEKLGESGMPLAICASNQIPWLEPLDPLT